jgi:hypothetical protein
MGVKWIPWVKLVISTSTVCALTAPADKAAVKVVAVINDDFLAKTGNFMIFPFWFHFWTEFGV